MEKLIVKDTDRYLGYANSEIKLHSIDQKDSSIKNYSFENGLWEAKVKDCNNYDKHVDISMWQDKDVKTSGTHSLQLSARKHIACTTSQDVEIKSKQYLLQFDHLTRNSQLAAYEILFDDIQHTTIKKDIVSGGRWRTHQSVITVPDKASSFKIRLYGYPDYRLQKRVVNNYDNVIIRSDRQFP